MTTTLPYEFDTMTLWEKTLKVGFWFLLIFAASALFASLIGNYAAAIHMTLMAAFLFVLGRFVLRFPNGSAGTITREGVVVRSGNWYGRTLPGPSGTYPIQGFRCIRIEHVPGTPHPDIQCSAQEVVYLVGHAGNPTIRIASVEEDSHLGEELASLLGLPYEKTNWSNSSLSS
jgi:hypothetical protein